MTTTMLLMVLCSLISALHFTESGSDAVAYAPAAVAASRESSGRSLGRPAPKPQFFTAYACENDILEIACPDSNIIRIIRVNFGRFSVKLCNPDGVTGDWSLSCVSRNALGIVSERCKGQRSCEIEASSEVFDDQCPSTPKYLEVHYNCYPDPGSTTTTARTTTERTIPSPATTKSTTIKPSTTRAETSSRSSVPSSTSASVNTTTAKHESTSKATTVDDNYCRSKKSRDITWPGTPAGAKATMPCPNNTIGEAIWRCGFDGEWASESPDLSNCVSPWVTEVTKQIDAGASATRVMTNISVITTTQINVGGDLIEVTKTMVTALDSAEVQINGFAPQEQIREWEAFTEAMVVTSSNLLENEGIWNDLNYVDQIKTATSVLNSLERNGNTFARGIHRTYHWNKWQKNLLLRIDVVDTVKEEYIRFPQENPLITSLSHSSVRLPAKHLPKTDGFVKAVFAGFSNIGQHMHPFHPATVDKTKDSKQNPRTVVNSPVIFASLGETHTGITPLEEPIILALRHQEQNLSKPKCVFWNFSEETNLGHWSDYGCSVLNTNDTHTVCSCNHLTSFAVLMNIHGIEITEKHALTLNVITYIGCITSIGCLLLAFLTFAVLKGLHCDRNTIHMNLCATLMLGEILFLAGISQTQNQVTCAVIAGFLHYLFLSAFAWMLMEGLQLYVMLIEVFEPEQSRARLYYVVSYGTPALIVALSAAVYPSGYGTEEYCWLTTQNYFVLAFAAPVALVLMANSAFLTLAICMMCDHSKAMAAARNRDTSKLQTFRSWIKGAIVLLCLLGLTWLLGFLYVNEQTIGIAYAFTVVNILQGVFIFIFYCLLNEKVQKEYKRFLRRQDWLPDSIRGVDSALYSQSPTSQGSNWHFHRFWSQEKRRKSSSLDGNSINFAKTDSKSTNATRRLSENVDFIKNETTYEPNINRAADNKNNAKNLVDKLCVAYALPKEVETLELEQCQTLRKDSESLLVCKPKLSQSREQKGSQSTTDDDVTKEDIEKEDNEVFTVDTDDESLLTNMQPNEHVVSADHHAHVPAKELGSNDNHVYVHGEEHKSSNPHTYVPGQEHLSNIIDNAEDTLCKNASVSLPVLLTHDGKMLINGFESLPDVSQNSKTRLKNQTSSEC